MITLEETHKRITGLKEAIAEKTKKQRIFLKLQGLDDEILKRKEEVADTDTKLDTAKESLKDLRNEKEQAIRGVAEKIEERITRILPHGKAVISFPESKDGQVIIGWEMEIKSQNVTKSIFIRYEGLSGAQKVMFDQALSYAMLTNKNGILIYEAAEVDRDNLKLLLEKLKDTGFQVIVNTWYNPPVAGFSKILKNWNVIKL